MLEKVLMRHMELDLDIRTRATLSAGAACVAAMIALIVAMGVGRFAFTAMLPLMVRDGVLVPETGSWLAASNYLGYLLGALTASRIAGRPSELMGGSLIGIAILTAPMGLVESAIGWSMLRFAAGVLSAWGLVATSAWALAHFARAGRSDLAGTAFAGVGLGIALVGMFCLAGAQPGVSAALLWLELGGLSALAVAVTFLLLRRGPDPVPTRSVVPADNAAAGGSAGLIVCYGVFGFGYILPATFLPALAREVIDDPQIFGLAWPLFGLAAAASTVVAAWYLGRANRVRVWAISHLVMAVGVVLPSLKLCTASVGIAALLVGSTFMVITMLGMQEARARQPANATGILAKMTAAFAIGQLAGPVATGVLGLLPGGHATALDAGLQIAAFALVASAVYLWIDANRSRARE